MYVITVSFVIRPQYVTSFRDAVTAQARNSLSREVGCRQFDVSVDPEDSTQVFLYEIYDDQAAFEKHLESEHFKNFDATVKDWLESKTVEAWQRIEPA